MDFANINERIKRARERNSDLCDSILAWGKSPAYRVHSEIAPDRHGWKLVLDTCAKPPLNEWALDVNEIVNPLRASLDNLCMIIAKDFCGIKDPKLLKLVHFPICGDATEWKKENKKEWMVHVPPGIREKIERVQPFRTRVNRSDIDRDPLLLLRDFNNFDKHYDLVFPELTLVGISHTFTLKFESAIDASRCKPCDVVIKQPSFAGKEVLINQSTEGRISSLNGAIKFSVFLQLTLGERKININNDVAVIGNYTENVISQIKAALLKS